MSRPDRAALMASVYDRPFSQTGPRRVEIPEGVSLAEIVRLAVPDPLLASHVRIQLDGEWVEREAWDRVPEAGSCLTLAVRPAGGDSGNKFLRTLLQIAVIAVATWVGGGAGGAIASKFWATAAAASVMVVGNLAINALVPPPQPSLEPGRFDRGYTIEGARNQYDPYGPVTVSFGEVRIFPKFQGLPVQETHGDDTYIRFLLSLGPMPLEIVPGSIRIGETEIDTFQGVEIETRLKPADPPLTLYARDPFAEQVGATLTPEAGWVTRTTAPAVTEIIAVIAFPLGLGGKNKKGNDEYASATVAIEYQPVSADPASGAWSSYRAGTPLVNDRLAELGEDRLRSNPFLDMAALESGYEQAGAGSGPVTWRRKESGKPFQREVRFAVPQGQYRVRVRRTDPEIDDGRTANRVQFAQLISIAPTDPNPEPDHAVMAVRIKASDQLSGVVDTLNLVLRRIAPTLDPAILDAGEPDLGLVTGEDWTGEAVTASPVDAALFAMRGPMVVNSTPDDEIDWPAWAAFARWCKLKGYRFDYGLTGPMSRGDFVRMACAAGRARPVRINGKWSVVIDGPRPDGPRQLFTARNVSNFRVVRTFPGEVHALRVRFPNRFEGYREDERVVYFEGYSLDGSEAGTQVATKIEALDLPGVTDPDQIYELARFFGATAMQQTERFSFDCDIEYLVSNYGDLVAIQHPVMVLGLGAGRIVEVETNASGAVIAITLDRTVEMIAGERYGLAWRRVIEPESGAARVEVQGAFEVDAVAGETARLVPIVPVSPADGPRPRSGDLVAFGHYGEETARALIKQITPRVGFEATVETVLEAPIRYQAGEGPIPTHNTALVTPPRRRPPSPELVSVNVTAEQIHISLSAPAGYEDRIVSIEASWRQSPDENAEARWTPLAPLGADSRVISFTPPDPAAEYDFQITAIDGAGRRSDPPLIVSQIAADNLIDPPRNVVAIGAVSDSANGVRQPVLQIAAEPDEDQTLTELLVEIRPSGSTELADFQPLAVLPPDRPNRDVRDIAPGATLDVGFRYRARRGERLIYSAYEIVEDVAIPDEVVASSSDRVGGIPASVVQGALDDANRLAEALLSLALDAQEERERRADDALVQIDASLGGVLAAVNQARGRADELLSDALAQLATDVDAVTASYAAEDADIRTELETRATLSQVTALIDDERVARQTVTSALSSEINVVRNSIPSLSGLATISYVQQTVASEALQRASAVGQLQAQIDALDPDGTGPDLSAYATITYVDAVETSLQAASATQRTQIEAGFAAELTAYASKTELTTAIADANSAIAVDIDGLQAQINALDPDGTGPDLSAYATINYVDTVEAGLQAASATTAAQLQAQIDALDPSGEGPDLSAYATITYVDAVAVSLQQASATAVSGLQAQIDQINDDAPDLSAYATITYVDAVEAAIGAARASALATLEAGLNGQIDAVAQDLILVQSEIATKLATRLITTAAGDGIAGLQIAASDINGVPADEVRLFADVVSFGETLTDVWFKISNVERAIYAELANGVRPFEARGGGDGQVIIRNASGVTQFDNTQGGMFRNGIAPGELGGRQRAYVATHDLVSSGVSARTPAQFNSLTLTTPGVTVLSGDEVDIDLSYRCRAVNNTFAYFFFQDQLAIEWFNGSIWQTHIVFDKANRVHRATGNVGAVPNTYGANEPLDEDASQSLPWTANLSQTIRARVVISARGAMSNGYAVESPNDTLMRSFLQLVGVNLKISADASGPFETA